MAIFDLFNEFTVESDDRDESDDYSGEDMDSDNRVSLEKLMSMREKISRDIKEEKAEFLEQLYELIGDWNGRLPNLRDIFLKKKLNGSL
uniref:Uncharacterized protein n=1 Tax=Trichogramma kaykai TaxID=54128 RepID=A0ABD2XBX8_9HYME